MIGLLIGRGTHVCDGRSDEHCRKHVRQVDIVHMTHTDVGYTDHPLVCREQQIRYLDIAIDAVLATREKPPEQRFYWTAETTLAVDDWWQTAAACAAAGVAAGGRQRPTGDCGAADESDARRSMPPSGRRCCIGCRRTCGSRSSRARPCRMT